MDYSRMRTREEFQLSIYNPVANVVRLVNWPTIPDQEIRLMSYEHCDWYFLENWNYFVGRDIDELYNFIGTIRSMSVTHLELCSFLPQFTTLQPQFNIEELQVTSLT